MYIGDPIQCPVMEMEHQSVVCMCVHICVCVCVRVISRVQLAIRVLGWVLFCSSPHGIPVGCSLMCYSDHQHFVRGQKHFLIASHTIVCEVETDFSKQVASNERHTLSLHELAIERGEKTSEISTVWGWEASKRTNYYPQTVTPQKKKKKTHTEINEDTN